jgi:hypothetical protein
VENIRTKVSVLEENNHTEVLLLEETFIQKFHFWKKIFWLSISEIKPGVFDNKMNL